MTHNLRGLGWLVEELDTSLSLAKEALGAYCADPEDQSQLGFAVGYLHQVSGSLSMAQCYGAVSLTQEIEALFNALLDDGSSIDNDDACEALEGAMMALPGYIRALLDGRDDTLAHLLTQINELRGVRALPLISSTPLFMPNMASLNQQGKELEDFTPTLEEGLKKLQRAYQYALLAYLKNRDQRKNQLKITAVFDRLQDIFKGSLFDPLWRIASAFFSGLVDKNIFQSPPTRFLLWEIDRTLRQLADEKTQVSRYLPPESLVRNLLYYIAIAPNDGSVLGAIKEEFSLDQALPVITFSEREGVLLTQFDGDVITALSHSLQAEVAVITNIVDGVETGGRDVETSGLEVKSAIDLLVMTLMMTGQIKLARSLSEVANMAVETPKMASGDGSELSAVKIRLQSIQHSLQDWALNYAQAPLASDLLTETAYVVDDAQRSLIREVRNVFESIKESIVGYIASQWDGKFLAEIPRQFEHIFGAVEVIGLNPVALIVEQLGEYISVHLLHSKTPPEWTELDALADAITGFEYYLEAIDKGLDGEQLEMLRITAHAMTKLGFEIDPHLKREDPEDTPRKDEVSDVQSLAEDEASSGETKLDSELYDDEIEPEIREIFIEEAREVLAELVVVYPDWLANQPDQKALNEIRRGFHTLKGSGRMVNAHAIAELAWAIENMLNKVLEGSGSVVPEMSQLLDLSLGVIPSLVENFERGAKNLPTDCSSIIAAAEALANGQPAMIPQLGKQAVNPESVEPMLPGLQANSDEKDPEELVEQELTVEISPVIDIFIGEAGSYIDTLADFLGDFRQPSMDFRLLPAGVQRALHTLQASAGMAGIATIPVLANTLEDFLTALFASGQNISSSTVSLLETGVEHLRNILEQLEAGEPEDKATLESYLSSVDLARSNWQKSGVTSVNSTGLESIQQLMATGMENILIADTLLDQWYGQPAVAEQDVAALVDELIELGAAGDNSVIPSLSELCREFSLALSGLSNSGQRLTETALAELKAAHDLLLRMIDAVAVGQLIDPVSEELLGQLQAQAAAYLPSTHVDPGEDEGFLKPEDPGGLDSQMAGESYDQEILPFFIEEAGELLEDIESAMQAWRDKPEDTSQGEKLNRVLHTLKGGARLAGLVLMGDLSHDLEAFILQEESRIVSGDAEIFNVLFARYDELASILEKVKSESSEQSSLDQVDAAEPLSTIEVVEEGELLNNVTDTGQDDKFNTAIEAVKAFPASAGSESAIAATPPAKGTRAASLQESIKIPAQVLDNLVNLAGEASIARGRVEQGVGDSAYALEEMEDTITRLRHQVRQLGRQTEAQIQFRREQIESSDSADFDPLELDRYSQLQQLSRGLEESGSDLQDLKDTLLEKAQAVEALLLMQSRINLDLQENLMKTRLVPFSRLVPRLRRVVRQVSQELDKQVSLGLNNIEGEMDRSVLEKIITPIEHMLRNAIDHGIETEEERLANGKPGGGNISLSFQREGGEIVITVADDGKGLDVAAIRERAISKKIIAADIQASDGELLRLIFQPGFSTAASVSQVSGRGVGMDVVRTEVHQLGGSISIDSILGQGVVFTIRLPFTVSVNRALLVKGVDNTYALPLSSIVGVTQISAEELNAFYSDQGKRLDYAGFDYQVCSIGTLLYGDQASAPIVGKGKAVLILVEAESYRYAVHVDAIDGNQEIIVKGLGTQFSNVPGVAGATILSSGKVVVILDLPSLLRSVGDRSILESSNQGGSLLRASSFDYKASTEIAPKTIMVVDDSVTVRKVTSRVLEREGFNVVTAKDGVEATDMLAEARPDLMLLDIEMPRMDGFEVARVVRSSEDFSQLPIIMISSRTGEKHQQRAESLGINEFLGKPYQEDELLSLLDELLDFSFA